jgi:uncharacterized membrane protein YciS (DUF1049 family)
MDICYISAVLVILIVVFLCGHLCCLLFNLLETLKWNSLDLQIYRQEVQVISFIIQI